MVDGKNKSDSRGHVEGMCYTIRNQLGIRVRLIPSSPITTATKPVRRSHRLRHRMAKVQDTAILEPNRERSSVRARPYQGCRTADQDDKKSYAYVRRRDLTFKVDDFVYLKVSPMRGVRRFNMKGKLAPRYIGPFKIVERKGEVAYKLELPPNLSGIHNVFHVSQLKKCLRVPEEQAPLEGLDVQEDLTYTEHPMKILETSERVTGNRRVKMCRVQRESSHRG
ncbi:hypothetical protein U9M48_000048 [Paspalum notatum var. saurae]|uniref:Tf2-1-like SH3-like domain-containing protein n=1 Tax=Paspalum notatum var. saurae TaxID=547442 RepID=A0AAQ3PET8_PASNO